MGEKICHILGLFRRQDGRREVRLCHIVMEISFEAGKLIKPSGPVCRRRSWGWGSKRWFKVLIEWLIRIVQEIENVGIWDGLAVEVSIRRALNFKWREFEDRNCSGDRMKSKE